MLYITILFFIALSTAFGMLSFTAWELRTGRTKTDESVRPVTVLSFRQFEKIMLYSIKYIIQWIVLVGAKYWFIASVKVRKIISEKWPTFHKKIANTNEASPTPTKPSFVKRAVLESKTKIKRIKEKVHAEHK